MSQKSICFVIMGFGKKKDPVTNRSIDLNETFKKIIKPAVLSCNYKCVRADEIMESGMIDRSMYALLYSAELVIADISTYNPNAIYELGVRHTFKPYSTIIIKEDEGNIPFDISHIRILNYKHLGNKISNEEVDRSIRELKNSIRAITGNPKIDSPIYTVIPKIQKPVLSDEDLQEIISELHSKEDTVYALMEKAKTYMENKNFTEAAKKWKQLGEMTENEEYFIQQEAICTYKSENPNPVHALTNALVIINKISKSTDTETLGITGAINKKLWENTEKNSYLDTAIASYKKGWNLYQDHYTGGNYAQCCDQKVLIENDERKIIYYKVESETIRRELIHNLLQEDETDDLKWKYATLANCYYAFKETNKYEEYEKKFYSENPLEWEKETYQKGIKTLSRLID